MNLIRGAVSKKKVRYQKDGFDLDLTYVTDRLIAMGFPSEGAEGIYRNSMTDVKNFFTSKHDGHYKVYNLCSERSYSANHFKNATASFPFDDHCPCPFHLLIKFCEDASQYLKLHPKNIIAVHCKAGKGRTGLVLCCYLMFIGTCKTAQEALDLYAAVRTMNKKGVTIPSQQRWVRYFQKYLETYRAQDPPKPWKLEGVFLEVSEVIISSTGIPKVDAGSFYPYIKIETIHNKQLVFHSKTPNMKQFKKKKGMKEQVFSVMCDHCVINADVNFTLWSASRIRDQKVCGAFVNTTFLSENTPQKDGTMHFTITKKDNEIDGASKDKGIPADFSITIIYKICSQKSESLAREATLTATVKGQPQSEIKKAVLSGNAGLIRRLVSKKKKRYMQGGFDLDLSYICESEDGNPTKPPYLIAMGFPSVSLEGIYRNQMSEVQRFLKAKHDGHYKVYNLCSERTYTPNYFENSTASYPFDDHNPCPFNMLVKFCDDAAEYLGRDPDNVCVVHCKAGKGRTGLVLSALLMKLEVCGTSKEALRYYGRARTNNDKGVTIPSQRRYVSYYGEYLDQITAGIPFDFPVHGRKISLLGFAINICPTFSGGGCIPYFKVTTLDKTVIYNYKTQLIANDEKLQKWKKKENKMKIIKFPNERAPAIQGDIHIVWYTEDNLGKDSKMFGFWINTNFIDSPSIKLAKDDLDSANKDKSCARFDKNFECEVFFGDLPTKEGQDEAPSDMNSFSMSGPPRRNRAPTHTSGQTPQRAFSNAEVLELPAIQVEDADELEELYAVVDDEEIDEDLEDEDGVEFDDEEEQDGTPASSPTASSTKSDNPLWALLETRLAENGKSMSDIQALTGRTTIAAEIRKLGFNDLGQVNDLVRNITKKNQNGPW